MTRVSSGTIIMWGLNVSDIPDGWALCDGSNGTPDLRNKFIMGASNSTPVGNTGGSNSVTLTEANLPFHEHGVDPSMIIGNASDGTHGHNYSEPSGTIGISSVTNTRTPLYTISGAVPEQKQTGSGGIHAHGFFFGNQRTNSTGSGTSHTNLPPYRAVLFIMKK